MNEVAAPWDGGSEVSLVVSVVRSWLVSAARLARSWGPSCLAG